MKSEIKGTVRQVIENTKMIDKLHERQSAMRNTGKTASISNFMINYIRLWRSIK